jgi:two-component system OmpR family sensor kinase
LRVAAVFAVSMAVVLAGIASFLYVRLGSDLSAAHDRQLRLRAQDLSALIRDPNDSLAHAGGASLIERGESYAQLLDAQARVVDATRLLGDTPLLDREDLAAARAGPIFRELPSIPGLDERSRILATPVERNGEHLVLVVGATLEDRAETLESLRTLLFVAGPIGLALATLAGYFLAGLSLRPVESMRRRAEEISAETPGDRLPVPATRDEIERLGRTLNEMLTRLHSALERERDFVADAGHELRTPLALLRTELELATRQGGSAEELRVAMRSASEEAERLALLAEDLLLIARTDRGRLPLRVEELELDALFETMLARFAWRAADADRHLDAEPARGLRIEGDRIRLEQALSNLVDNALRYGEGDVRLYGTSGETTELHVVDDGPGFPPDFSEQAFERFTRADTARGRGGAGLGLSIVRAIAEAHGGTAGAPTHRLEGSTLGSRSRRPPPTAPLLRPAAWRSPYRHDVKTGSRPPGSLRRGVDADDVQPLLADVLEHVRRVRDHHRHVAGQASLPAALAHGRGHHRIGQLARADPESASDSGTSLVARGRPSAT